MTARKRASFGSILLTVGSIAVVASCAGESSQDAAVTPLRRDSGVACVDTTAAVGTAPRALDSAMDQALQTHGVAGCAIAIVKRGRTVLAKGYGIATPDGELETARRVHLLASASKPVTAVALMQLVEAGKLRLDDDVNMLLHATGLVVKHPAKPRAPITVRMLLTHTAGIGDSVESYDPTWFSRGDSSVTLRDFVVGYFTPGSRYSGGSDTFGAQALAPRSATRTWASRFCRWSSRSLPANPSRTTHGATSSRRSA